MRCLEARVSMQGARDDRGRDGLASPFVLGPAALSSASIFLARLSAASCAMAVACYICVGHLTSQLCGPFDLTTVLAI